jgi:hypothetical protein
MSQDVPGHESALSFSSLEEERKKESGHPKNGRSTGHRLPLDWQPQQREIEEAHRLGFTEQEVGGIAQEMRIWAGANANRAVARKADWDLTFLGWVRRSADKRPPKPKWRSGIEGVL